MSGYRANTPPNDSSKPTPHRGGEFRTTIWSKTGSANLSLTPDRSLTSGSNRSLRSLGRAKARPLTKR